MPRRPATPWPTASGSVFFGDAASDASLSRATNDGRIRRLARGLYSADLRSGPAELVARNRWAIVARLVPDVLVADRSAAEGGVPVAGMLTVVSSLRKETLVLPGLVIAPRLGPGPLSDDLSWAGGLRLTSEARTLVDNLAVSRGRGGRPARTLSRAELEDWVVRTSQRRPDGWALSLRSRAIEVCAEVGAPERRPRVEDIIGVVAGTRQVRSGAGRLLAARAAGREYDPDRVARFDELTSFLTAVPAELDVPAELPSLDDEPATSLPFFDALGDAFPWVEFLPAADRRLFLDEFSRIVLAAAALDDYEPLSQLVREWRATAEVHADPKLARSLQRAVAARGEPVPAPSA